MKAHENKPLWSSAFRTAPHSAIVTKRLEVSLQRPVQPVLDVPSAIIGVKMEDSDGKRQHNVQKTSWAGEDVGEAKISVTVPTYDSTYVFSSASDMYAPPPISPIPPPPYPLQAH